MAVQNPVVAAPQDTQYQLTKKTTVEEVAPIEKTATPAPTGKAKRLELKTGTRGPSNDEVAAAQVSGMSKVEEGFVGANRVTPQTAALDEAIAMNKRYKELWAGGKELRDIIADVVAPELSTEEQAKIKAEVPEARRGALDYLLNTGPEQLERPEVNKRQVAMELLTVGITNSIANIIQSASGASGLVPVAGAQGMEENLGSIQKGIMLTKEQQRETDLKQHEINMRYKDDVRAAIDDYENELTIEQREYVKMKSQAIAEKVATAQTQLQAIQGAEGNIAAYGIQKEKLANESEESYQDRLQRAQMHNKQMRADRVKLAFETQKQLDFMQDQNNKGFMKYALSTKDLALAVVANNAAGVDPNYMTTSDQRLSGYLGQGYMTSQEATNVANYAGSQLSVAANATGDFVNAIPDANIKKQVANTVWFLTEATDGYNVTTDVVKAIQEDIAAGESGEGGSATILDSGTGVRVGARAWEAFKKANPDIVAEGTEFVSTLQAGETGRASKEVITRKFGDGAGHAAAQNIWGRSFFRKLSDPLQKSILVSQPKNGISAAEAAVVGE